MDSNEFERIAPSLRKRIVTMVGHIVSDNCASQLDDVAQDTLLRLWTMRDRLDNYASVESLAVVMARNMAIDIVRRSHGDSLPLDAVADVHSMTPYDELAEAEAGEVMDSVMRGLTAAQRALIRMRHEEGMEIAQIAAAIGSTEGAVRVALSRLRRHIMELFKTKTNE